jgi:4-amino-4-deoxy-L-arabinose transferase-like glycosyltransferase
MLALSLLLAILLLVICGFAPGFFMVRRLRWNPMEKLCGSVGVSFTVLYLVFSACYWFLPNQSDVSPQYLWLISAACLALGLLARRDMLRLFRCFRVRQALAGFSFLLVWTFLLLAGIRNYSGANWYGDWLEHFQRSLFFLHGFPATTPILFGYQLPARPPAMNELAAFFLAQTRDRFEVFQVIFAFLNLLMFLPCCLIMPSLVGARRTSILPLTALFAMNPVVIENVTYTWTKAFTAFYVILAICFYLAGLRKNDPVRITLAFLAVSMGFLAHYSAGPYLVFLTLHCLFWKRPRRFRQLAITALACGLLLATWFAWSVAVYGIRVTFTSNTSVTYSQRYQGNPLRKVSANLVDSIVPFALRSRFAPESFTTQGSAASLRDAAFLFYQNNLVFSMGLVGGPLVLYQLYGAFFRRPRSRHEASFWRLMIPFCVVLGIASTGERDRHGVAHLTLLPLEILGLSLLAASFPLRRRVLLMLLAGCLIDFSLGIALHARVESLENTPQRKVFAGLNSQSANAGDAVLTPLSPADFAWNNWFLKHQYALNRDALAELDRRPPRNAAFGRAQIERSLAEDDSYWHGWYARNNGSVEFLGDHSAWGLGLPGGLLLLLLLGLLYALIKQGRLAPNG